MGKKIPRTRCSGTMTDAQLKSFIISGLRQKSSFWKPTSDCRLGAREGTVINPKTGRAVIGSVCDECKEKGQEKDGNKHLMDVDHIKPVVPINGWGDTTEFLGVNWNEYISNMLVEVDGLRVLCKPCHKIITKKENEERRENK